MDNTSGNGLKKILFYWHYLVYQYHTFIYGELNAVEVLMDCYGSRFLGFGVGMVVYASWFKFFNEGITPKVKVSLVLATLLLGVQVLWK